MIFTVVCELPDLFALLRRHWPTDGKGLFNRNLPKNSRLNRENRNRKNFGHKIYFVRMLFAERQFAGTSAKSLAKKLTIDQFLLGPMLMASFFTYNEREYYVIGSVFSNIRTFVYNFLTGVIFYTKTFSKSRNFEKNVVLKKFVLKIKKIL